MLHISNKKRKRLTATINRAERQRKPRKQKHALAQGDPNTPGRSTAVAVDTIERPRGRSADPTATPARITAELLKRDANGAEQQYFYFHHQHGAKLRAKYRP